MSGAREPVVSVLFRKSDGHRFAAPSLSANDEDFVALVSSADGNRRPDSTNEDEESVLLTRSFQNGDNGSPSAIVSDSPSPNGDHESLLQAGGGSGSGGVPPGEKKGLSVLSTSFFILTTVLFTIPLPYAVLQTGLISGVLLMTVLPLIMIYMAILLGRCWVMMMERFPEKYRGQQVRRPFPAIGREAGGRGWELAVAIAANLTNFGVTVIDLLVSVLSIQILLPGHFSDRIWLLFCTAAMMPFVWLGSPMESWIVGWGGGIMGLAASITLLLAVVIGGLSPALASAATSTVYSNATTVAMTTILNSTSTMTAPTAQHTITALSPAFTGTVTFSSFWIGTSTLFFTYSGMSIFPTLQHDMKEPKKWTRAILLSYVFIASFAMATAIAGHQLFGSETNASVLLNVQCHESRAGDILATVCSAFYTVVSLCNGIVTILPVVQDCEELLRLPEKANYKHIMVRTGLLLACLGFAEAIPHFHKYITLVGSTAISFNNFIFPPLFYYWLCKKGGKDLRLGQKMFFAEMIVVGIVSALAGTYSAIENIIESTPLDPC